MGVWLEFAVGFGFGIAGVDSVIASGGIRAWPADERVIAIVAP